MYFRNKFDEDFLFLCNHQPKCKDEQITLSDVGHPFWIFRRFTNKRQAKTIHVIPLLLFNKIESSNDKDHGGNDLNVDNYMMICENKGDTIITCNWVEEGKGGSKDSTRPCDGGIGVKTGDLSGEYIK